MQQQYTSIIFDLGAVLIDWNPRYLYNKIFTTPEETEHFLEHICTSDWNEEQDAGRALAAATELLVQQHPAFEDQIRAYYGRWQEMLGGVIEGTLAILQQLKESGRYKLYALTNWSGETFPIALTLYPFLGWFDGIVVSGHEKIRKPHPSFYQLLLDRYQIPAAEALFIDDNLRNIHGAEACGIDSIHFTSPEQLKQVLIAKTILS
ncbi:HAD family phosphatase [Chitinophaga agrisoli]|uniref:HAD family phosphatase n=1 Tax=Chitinophaga agrisoli TaxID=2607653 RepID=A0A5B2VPP5_9BACT|nr:HAD family phosphatase [Chitinophaga agrisoli]KAA2240059.1 HAD family phosphatase [Chitinophaga agrisoli]